MGIETVVHGPAEIPQSEGEYIDFIDLPSLRGFFRPSVHHEIPIRKDSEEILRPLEVVDRFQRFSRFKLATTLLDDFTRRDYVGTRELPAATSPPLARAIAEDMIDQLYLDEYLSLIVDEDEQIVRNPRRLRLDEGEESRRKRVTGYVWNSEKTDDLRSNKPTRKPQRKLRSYIDDAKNARSDLVEKNIGLVRVFAIEYFLMSDKEIPVDEFLQIGYGFLEEEHIRGNRGLLRAIETFDWRRGNAFSTLASWYINLALQDALQAHRKSKAKLPGLERTPTSETKNPVIVFEFKEDINILRQYVQYAYLTGSEMQALELLVMEGRTTGEAAHKLRRHGKQPSEQALSRLRNSGIEKLRAVARDLPAARIRTEVIDTIVHEEFTKAMPTMLRKRKRFSFTETDVAILKQVYVENKSIMQVANERGILYSTVHKRHERAISKIMREQKIRNRAIELASHLSNEKVREYVRLLPENQQQVLEEYFGNRQKTKDIAEGEFVSLHPIQSRRRDALKTLVLLAKNEEYAQEYKKSASLSASEVNQFLNSSLASLLSETQRQILEKAIVQGQARGVIIEELSISRSTYKTIFNTARTLVSDLMRDTTKRQLEEQIIGIKTNTVLRNLRSMSEEQVNRMIEAIAISYRDKAIILASVFANQSLKTLAETFGISKSQAKKILDSVVRDIARSAVQNNDQELVQRFKDER